MRDTASQPDAGYMAGGTFFLQGGYEVSRASYQTDGIRSCITIPAPSDMQFYRLRQVCPGS